MFPGPHKTTIQLHDNCFRYVFLECARGEMVRCFYTFCFFLKGFFGCELALLGVVINCYQIVIRPEAVRSRARRDANTTTNIKDRLICD